MKVAIVAVLAATATATAHADDAIDPNAAEAAGEANLETKAPRAGVTMAGALGGGIIISRGKTATVGTLDLRLGHVANASTIVTVELIGGTYAHNPDMTSGTRIDGQGNLLVGAQVYIAPSVWLRGAGGFGVHTTDDGTGRKTGAGIGGLGGAGIDLVRWHYAVLGIEGFYSGTFAHGGYVSLGGLALGLSYY
jgi:hypothetical protein